MPITVTITLSSRDALTDLISWVGWFAEDDMDYVREYWLSEEREYWLSEGGDEPNGVDNMHLHPTMMALQNAIVTEV
jgi:hypothetical protein